MARPTKAKKSKHENVSKASAARRKTSQLGNPAISSDTLATENSSSSTQETTGGSRDFQEGSRNGSEREWDVALGEELPDIECTELQDIGDEEDVEVAMEFALDSFTKFLVDAQVAAQKLERRRERESGRKRKREFTKACRSRPCGAIKRLQSASKRRDSPVSAHFQAQGSCRVQQLR
jgi:hypothetical protein